MPPTPAFERPLARVLYVLNRQPCFEAFDMPSPLLDAASNPWAHTTQKTGGGGGIELEYCTERGTPRDTRRKIDREID